MSNQREETPGSSVVIRRQRAFITIAVGALILSLAGLAVSLTIKSPAQQALDQAPPSPSAITAKVQSKILESTVAVRGDVVSSGAIPVTSIAAPEGAIAILTALPKAAGSSVENGDVVAVISGRPIIALFGQLPAYRDFKPGTSGADVTQLQSALSQLGYLPSRAINGVFGSPTKLAVNALYRDRGFDAATTSDADPSESGTVAAAKAAVTSAQRKLDTDTLQLQSPADPSQIPLLNQQIGFDKSDLKAANDAVAQLIANTGTEVPLGEVVFAPSFPASIESIAAAVGSNLSDLKSPLLTLDTGNLAISAIVPAGSNHGIAANLPVTITDDVNQRTTDGSVQSLGPYTGAVDASQAQTGTSSGSGSAASNTAGYPLTVAPNAPLDSSWLGANVLLSIVVKKTAGPVLVVPVIAVHSRTDGATFVTVRRVGLDREVEVKTGLLASGEIEVTPVARGSLKMLDRVLVG